MDHGEGLRARDENLHRRAEKAISLSTSDFIKIPTADVQDLVRDLVRHSLDHETEIRRLQESLKQVEELQRECTELHDFAPVGYFNVDNLGTITGVNFTACDMLCESKDNLVNTPFTNLVDPRYYDEFRSYLKEITETGQRLSTEIEMTRHDGTKFDVQLQTVGLYEKSRIAFRISAADITQRKRVERALSESEQRYRDLADLFPEPIFETDTHGKVTYANRKAMTTFGISGADMRKGISLFDYVSPDHKSMARERFEAILNRQGLSAEEYTLTRKGGGSFPCLVHSGPVLREGIVSGVRGVVIDISERKQAEMALKDTKLRLETTLDNMMEGCQIISRDWRYAYINAAAAQQGRRNKDELLGRTMMEMYPGIGATELFQRLRDCMENRTPNTIDNEFTFPDGSKRWFELRIEPVPEGILVLSLDITDRKAAEARLKRGIERLEYIHGLTKMAGMQPVGLLMIEHRLIERAVAFLSGEKARMEQGGSLDRDRVKYAVDFFRTYADKTHHGKEEDVLFRMLAGKPLTLELKQTMDALVEEHKLARRLVNELWSAGEQLLSGDPSALAQFIARLGALIELYPAHIEKEDRHFFLPSMDYLTSQEQNDMLLEFWEFDRQMIHVKYTEGMELLRNR